jgi:ADP-ribose pyrophosphatase
MPGKSARVLSSKTSFKGKVFSVTTDEMIEPTGVRAKRDVVRHQGSVVVLPVDDSGREPRVLLIRQYRYTADEYLWELTAGRIDEGEKPLEAAKRELAEETGFSARKWKKALTFYSSPGFLDEVMHLYLAEALTAGEATPEEDEKISMRFFPLSQVVRMIAAGKMNDGKLIAGVLWYAFKRGQNK